jgi:hypothetical protein
MHLKDFLTLVESLVLASSSSIIPHVIGFIKDKRKHVQAQTAALKNPAIKELASVGEDLAGQALASSEAVIAKAADKAVPGTGKIVSQIIDAGIGNAGVGNAGVGKS